MMMKSLPRKKRKKVKMLKSKRKLKKKKRRQRKSKKSTLNSKLLTKISPSGCAKLKQ
jgi:hypothetical protein